MLRTRVLARMRAQAESLMTETATISRPGSVTVDSSGNWTTGAPAETSSACRLIPASNTRVSAVIGEQDVTRDYYELIFPYNADVQSGDRVTVDSIEYELLKFEESHTDVVSIMVLATPVFLE